MSATIPMPATGYIGQYLLCIYILSIFAVNSEDTFARCEKYSRPALALGLSKKLDISRSLIRIFDEIEDTFVRCKKYSSKLDISRSLIRIFAIN